MLRVYKHYFSFAVVTLLLLIVANQTLGRVVTFDKSTANDFHQLNYEGAVTLLSLNNEANDNNNNNNISYTPVLFWHGMGDSAYGSVNVIRLALQKQYPGMEVYSIQIGNSSVEDELAGYFSNVNLQVEQACQMVLKNDQIRRAGALNAVGFSQGAQFIRALVQRCPLRKNGIQVRNLISLGGQHQGVFGLPRCNSALFCDYIRYMLSTGAYERHVQEHLVQAQYWHDSLHEGEYKTRNLFLPDINNELSVNQTYRNNLLALQNLVLIEFQQDEMVVPRESSLFGFYAPGQNKAIRPLELSPLYLEDRLGLKQLNDSGRLKLATVPGYHLQFKMSWFIEQIGAKYLAN